MNIFDRNEFLAFAVHQGMYRKIIKMSEKKQSEKKDICPHPGSIHNIIDRNFPQYEIYRLNIT